MKIVHIENMHSAFEVGGGERLLPMEGLRGVAVGLVFLQHYCMQFKTNSILTGWTKSFAITFSNLGNYGVELFFVLSGFLIYGILLKKRPPFILFMARRAQRLYPAFIVALLIGALADIVRPEPRIPATLIDGTVYLMENVLFLPGLFPIIPLFIVNWSLSYEWWFYMIATFLFSVCGIVALPPLWRVIGISGLLVTLLALSATGLPDVPVRGLCLLGGMLLAEARAAEALAVPAVLGIAAALLALVLCATVSLPSWLGALVIMLGFCALCSAAFECDPVVAAPLSWKYLRWFGNISYSYYLIVIAHPADFWDGRVLG